MDNLKYILKVKEIEKYFAGVIALNKISTEIIRGEVHGLVGKNGAGKSTLIKIISGIYTPDYGKIIFEDKEFDSLSPSLARTLGIQIVPQEQQFVPYLTVAENFFLGSWPKSKAGFIDFKLARRITQEALAKLKINIPTQRLAKDLTVVQRQLLSIAKAIFSDAKLIILDEPTPSLTENDIALLFGFIREFAKNGITFIYISHYLNEIFDVCDSLTVLRDGQLVHTGSVKDISSSKLIELMVGKAITKIKKQQVTFGTEIIKVSNLSSTGNFNDISFSIRKGEIIGIAGLLGCGSYELLKTLFGLNSLDKGSIEINGKKVHINTPEVALSYGIALLPEERRSMGLILGQSVESNISLSILKRLTNKIGLIKQSKIRDIAKHFVKILNIKTPSLIQEVRYLSGGNQQKVIVSRLLNTKPKLLVMLDPTAGIDVEAKEEIHKIMQELTSQEISILFLSSDLDELIDLSNRIFVMHNGKIIKEFKEIEADRHNIQIASEGFMEDL